jgi:hypothetical protein
MAFFNRYPYTDYNDLNLDWIIKTVKETVETWAQYRDSWEAWKNDTDQAFEDLYNYVHDFLDNLDIQQEVRDYIDILVQNGTIRNLVSQLWTELANEQAVLAARVSALEAGTTPEGSEVVGIRTGYNAQVYDTAGEAVREQVEELHVGARVLAQTGRYRQDPLYEAGYLDANGTINASSTRSTSVMIDVVPGMRLYNNGANLVYFGCYSAQGTFLERRTISRDSGFTLTKVFCDSYPKIRVSIYNVDEDLVYITDPQTLATAETVGRNGADYNLDTLTGGYLTFTGDITSPYTITIDKSSGNSDGLLLTDPSGGTGIIPAENFNFPYSITNNQILTYNINTRTIEIYTAAQLAAVTDPYIILCKNHYGRPKGGNWFRYYLFYLINQIDTGAGYPAYFAQHIASKAVTINASMAAAGASGDTFIFITDTHWRQNYKHSPALIKYLNDHANIVTVIHGGDVPIASETPDNMYLDVRNERAAFNNPAVRLYRTIGNHDMYCIDPDNPDPQTNRTTLTPDQGTGLMTAYLNQVGYPVHFGPNRAGNYYYWDNEAVKIRYIVLNNFERTADFYMSPEQITWFAETLRDMPDGWSTYIIGHCAIIQELNPNYYSVYSDVLGLINAVAGGSSYTYNGVTYDYAGSNKHIIAYHCGHYHKDDLQQVDNVWHVATTCDAFYNDNPPYTRTRNTYTEQAFDVVTINQVTKAVTLERIGSGADRRSFTYI